MSPDFRDVLAFHIQFDLPRSHDPAPMPLDQLAFRLQFLREERAEFFDAFERNDLVKTVDALIDLVYVAIGTALFLGAPRSGALGTWPTYGGTLTHLMALGLRIPARPELCELRRAKLFAMSSEVRIEMFRVAHDLALDEAGEGCRIALDLLRALVKTAYVTAAMMGTPWPRCWSHVQLANLAKVRAAADGSNSKRGSAFDIVKPAGWTSPDAAIWATLKRAGWQP